MDQSEEKRRRNTEYIQAVLNAVLNTGGPLLEWSVAMTGSGESARYWVIGPDRKVLKPSVSKADLAVPDRKVKSLIDLGSRYAELVAFHQSTSSDEDPQLELTYRRRQKVVMDRAHMTVLRSIEELQRTADDELEI
jgi:hypothetical protein